MGYGDTPLNYCDTICASLSWVTVTPHLIIAIQSALPSLACFALQNKLLSPARGES
jgi:hypothetical protein